MISEERLQNLKHQLSQELRPNQIKTDSETLTQFGHDESDTGDFPSQMVVFPEKTSEVQRVLQLCQAHDVPVTPVGARTGKSGGSLPLMGGVSLSLERMNRIKKISADDLIAVVEPGVITGDLMKAVEEVGLFYPPDPNSWPMCTLGGNIAENAGGPRALKYGVTRDYVLGLEWVLPSGELLRVGRNTIKGVAGYDLVGLFVGSEGTLGVATEIILQLIPLPKKIMTALFLFGSVRGATEAVSKSLAKGILPRTLELLDDVSIQVMQGKGFQFPQGTKAALIVEVDGNVQESLELELAAFGEVSESFELLDSLVAQNEEQREKIWSVRRNLSTTLRQLKRFKISEDIAVPRSAIPETVARLKQLGQDSGLLVATYGHAGDGNLHANILYDSESERPKVDEAVASMLRLTIELGGTITGEHGVGYAKRDFLPLEQGSSLIEWQKQLKRLFDPKGLMNPGKIFP